MSRLLFSLGIVLIFLIPYDGDAQISMKISESGEVYCKNKDYQFQIEGYFYSDRSKVYVCPKNIPLNVSVVDASTQTPITTMFEWIVNGSLSSETTNTINISKIDFNGDKSELEAEFKETITGNIVNIKVELRRNIELRFKESVKNYQFDDNEIQDYINHVGYGEKKGTPWNFIENGNLDILKAEVTKKKGYYAVNNIMSNNSNLNITPNSLSMTPEDITFDFSGFGQNIIEVIGCHETDPELLLFTESKKNYDIKFIRVCDTDDDIQVTPVGTMVSSPTDVCIDGGVDLTIDEMRDSSFLKGDDKFFRDNSTGRYYVHAGGDLKCETKANPAGPPDCPNSFVVASSMTAANDVLNKVAIDFVNTGDTTINFNYNVYSEDGKMEKKEQSWLHTMRHGSSPSANIEVYLVDDLGAGSTGVGNTQGRATSLGFNTMSIDVNDATSHVLVHELGHAIWSLEHPGCPCDSNYSGQFGIDDLKNFMHGVTNQVMDWNVRRYQFSKMH